MTDAQDTDLWASILAEAPESKKGAVVRVYHPFRFEGKVYTLRPALSCKTCAFDQSYLPLAQQKERNRQCRAAPNCDAGAFALFEPSDFAIMVARGEDYGHQQGDTVSPTT